MPLYFFAKSKAKGDFPEAVGPAIIIILNLFSLFFLTKQTEDNLSLIIYL